MLPPDILPSGILPSDILPADILSSDILSWATWSSFILSWAIAAVARPNTIISVVSCFFIVVLVVFNTELLRAVAALARVAGLALILHNAPGGPEQIMHVREGIRFELYDGGYSQLKLVVPPWRGGGAAETPEFAPAPAPKG